MCSYKNVISTKELYNYAEDQLHLDCKKVENDRYLTMVLKRQIEKEWEMTGEKREIGRWKR